MAHPNLGVVLDRLLAGGRPTQEATDGQLLQRFVSGHEADAFAALVRRQGPMVYGAAIKPVKGKR